MTGVPALSEIRSLEEALHRPEVRGNREAIEALLAEGFIEIGASGGVYERAAVIDSLMEEGGGGDNDDQLESFNYALVPVADSAVLLTYETKRTYGNGVTLRALRSSIWKHDGRKWQMLFHQGTVRP
ncbi:DUF4440 domain-containing protein [Hoeflea sp.]|uniref:nuclear transport factor 2 family protein n=1 Tax=Hoeflea sp. TaxID=1940281 RepID=UPI003A924CD0